MLQDIDRAVDSGTGVKEPPSVSVVFPISPFGTPATVTVWLTPTLLNCVFTTGGAPVTFPVADG